MKKITLLLIVFSVNAVFAQKVNIPLISADHAMVLQTDKDQHLLMVYNGKPLKTDEDYKQAYSAYRFNDGNSVGIVNNAYSPAGSHSLLEPAIQVEHANGDPSLDLKYVSHEQKTVDGNVSITSVELKDPVYPFTVTLFYKIYAKENVIEQWAEIKHAEKKAVKLLKYASANLYFNQKDFYVTTFHNNWAAEMHPSEIKLSRGMYSVDSKLGTRTMLMENNNFIIGFGKPAMEDEGDVMLGQVAWTGNFKLEFDVDFYENLRLIAGINPYASSYLLQPNTVFKTASLIYTFSHHGKGAAARNLQSWARNYQLLDGKGERLTLLNNWEATYFDFNEEKLTGLIKDAKKLGVDLFLLDDGWFGNTHPRNGDVEGLGDWQENKKKLPNGLISLVKTAEKEGVKFGVWVEPEMVNPKSDLYQNHKDWIIRQPDRPEVYMRNQLVLDLSNPEVQNFVYGIIDSLFIKNPGLAFIKWDCNAAFFNPYSAYLEKQKQPQSNLYVAYVNGLYSVLKRIRTKYPATPIMLCSGGGGRADYEALKYFTEFWPSDDTEPLERIFMQWNYSYFFPSIATCNHVTDWGKQPLKYRVDVASMEKLGFDIVPAKLDEKELSFCKQAIANYNRFKDIVWHGDMYRLVNPYEQRQASLMYVNADKSKAVVFNYLTNFRYIPGGTEVAVVLQGLDPNKNYKITETNVFGNNKPLFDGTKIYSGDLLMKAGINPEISSGRTSVILEVTEVK